MSSICPVDGVRTGCNMSKLGFKSRVPVTNYFFMMLMFVLNNDYQCFIVVLKNKSKKVVKRYCLNEKRVYFCTRNNGNVHLNTDKRLIQKKRSFRKKYQKKFVRNKNVTYLCAPQNTESSLKD